MSRGFRRVSGLPISYFRQPCRASTSEFFALFLLVFIRECFRAFTEKTNGAARVSLVPPRSLSPLARPRGLLLVLAVPHGLVERRSLDRRARGGLLGFR